ncbi:protein-tyrosine phosphatase-like protein, partial [Jimgerdemannia flammicorona]
MNRLFNRKKNPQDSDPDLIEDGIYLSGSGGAKNETFLKKKNIKAVLSIGNFDSIALYSRSGIDHTIIQIEDAAYINIIEHLPTGFKFFTKHVGVNKIVHCEKGMSRSVSLVLAYLMNKYKRKPMDDLLNDIKIKRPCAILTFQFDNKMLKILICFVNRPNDSFLAQLELFRKMGYRLVWQDKDIRDLLYNISNTSDTSILVRCRDCGRELAEKDNISNHKQFNDKSSHFISPKCDQYHIQPMDWMWGRGVMTSRYFCIPCPSCGKEL